MNITDEILNDEHFEYNINTGYIYSGLCQNWNKYPLELFIDVEWKLEGILWYKGKITVPYSEHMQDYLENRREMHEAEEELRKKPNHHPYLDYFMQPQGEGFALISFDENCILRNGEDSEFDYFFALKLTILDLMDLHEFLQYQLIANFKQDGKKYKIFLETLLIKYKDLFQLTSISEVVNNYINADLIASKNADLNNSETNASLLGTGKNELEKKSKTKDTPTRDHVLAIHFILEAFDCLNNDLTARARLVQFFNGREKEAKNIKDTRIYEVLKDPFISVDNSTKTLERIRPYFVELGLKQVTDLIDKKLNEINKPKSHKQK